MSPTKPKFHCFFFFHFFLLLLGSFTTLGWSLANDSTRVQLTCHCHSLQWFLVTLSDIHTHTHTHNAHNNHPTMQNLLAIIHGLYDIYFWHISWHMDALHLHCGQSTWSLNMVPTALLFAKRCSSISAHIPHFNGVKMGILSVASSDESFMFYLSFLFLLYP